jgi:preprotein translocase subunit SecB
MENINNSKSGFKVDSILLTESQFNRRGNINFKDSEQQVTFETGVGSKDNIVNVKLNNTLLILM